MDKSRNDVSCHCGDASRSSRGEFTWRSYNLDTSIAKPSPRNRGIQDRPSEWQVKLQSDRRQDARVLLGHLPCYYDPSLDFVRSDWGSGAGRIMGNLFPFSWVCGRERRVPWMNFATCFRMRGTPLLCE